MTRRLTSTACPARRRPAPCAKCSENTRTARWLRWTASTPGRRYESPGAPRLPPLSFGLDRCWMFRDTRWSNLSHLPSFHSLFSFLASPSPPVTVNRPQHSSELLLKTVCKFGAAAASLKVNEPSRSVLARPWPLPALCFLILCPHKRRVKQTDVTADVLGGMVPNFQREKIFFGGVLVWSSVPPPRLFTRTPHVPLSLKRFM